MKSVLTYVRSLLGWTDEDPVITPSFKRDRSGDDNQFDDDLPALKRLKHLKQTQFPDVMESNDNVWSKSVKSPKVRYIPIQVETGFPSTSTPNEITDKYSRVRTVPLKLVSVSENGPSTPVRKPRMHTPVKPVIHTVIDEDDDDDKVTWIETKKANTKKPTKIYIAEDDEDSDGEDVVFVKKIESPKPVQPYKYFVSKNDCPELREDPVRWSSLSRRLQDRNENISSKSYSKFIAPPGVTKSYKKVSAPVARWMQMSKPSNLLSYRNRPVNLYGNARSTLSEVFNLDEKKNYQELIKRVAGTTGNVSSNKSLEVIDLAQESAMFRNTLKAQKRSINEIKIVEKGLVANKESESSTEYNPITVASINSSDSEIEVVPSESSGSSVRIVPLNSLKDSFKDKPVTSKDWLANLDTKYRRKNSNTKNKLLDAQRESDIISKVSYEQRLAHLQHKFKYELSIPESLIEEPKPTLELPTLTPEQEKLVNRALGPGPPNQLLVEKFNLRIHRRDLQTLAGLNWLNDEVINFYMNLLMQRSEERKDLPKVYATNTFFYPKLMQSGHAGLKRWTRKVDIFAHELMVVPVHLGVHWCLSLVQFRARRVCYLDSMGGRNQPALDALLQYLRDEHLDKKGQPFDDSDWKTECLKDIPQQMNGSDCGMFACTFAEFASRGAPFAFSQQHMPALRRKAALEVLQARLLL